MMNLFGTLSLRTAVALLGIWCSVGVALADSVDKHIQNLRSDKEDVRAVAAKELGCG
jgi:hypothetical protein